MIKSIELKMVWVLSVAVLISSCSKSSSDSKPLQDEKVTDYTTASCEFKADQGNAALATVPTVDLVTSYFRKKYDQNLLSAVLSASTTETVRFAQLTNVKFYSVSPYKKKSCMMASFLPEASSFFQSKFDSVGDSTLGLYLSPNNGLVDGTNPEALILVRRDANRWVFVHEFMHHLFSKEVQDNTKTDEELKADVKDAIARIDSAEKNYKNSHSAADAKSYLNEIKRISQSFPEILRRFTLEEMTIETVLSEKLKARQFVNVPASQAINGAAYVYQSAKKAEVNLSAVCELNSEAQLIVLEQAGKIAPEESSAYTKIFKDSDSAVADFKNDLTNLKARSEKFLRESDIDPDKLESGLVSVQLAGFNPTESNHEKDGSGGCSHSRETEKLAEKTGQFLRSRHKK